MCWAHMKKNFVDHLNLAEKKNQFELQQDIDKLQESSSPEMFTKAAVLFGKKWEGEEKFMAYMNKMWLTTHRNWFEGVSYFRPSTNNACESFNNEIKKKHIFRTKAPAVQFVEAIKFNIRLWSEQMNFVTTAQRKILDRIWTEGYHLLKSDTKVTATSSGIYFPLKMENCRESDISKLSKLKWNTFHQFVNTIDNVAMVHWDKNEWTSSTCTCPNFFKEYICKHVIFVAVKEKCAIIPITAKDIPLGQKRKPGRPKGRAPALVREREEPEIIQRVKRPRRV